MNIIAWLILGLVAGAIAKAIYPGSQGGGIFATTGLGIIGAFLGGSLYTLWRTGTFSLTSSNNFDLGGLLVSVIGAVIALFIWGLLLQNKNT